MYGWVDRLDDWITYDEMAEAVQRIKGLCADDGAQLRRLLKDSGLTDPQVKEAVEVLLERGRAAGPEGVSPLENALRTRFDPNYTKYDPKRGINRVRAKVVPRRQLPWDFGRQMAAANVLTEVDAEFARHGSFNLADILGYKEASSVLAFAE